MFQTFLLLQDVMRLSHKSLRNNLKPYGLYKGQPKILGFLAHHEHVTKKDIAERFQVAMPTITKTIERLEANGFVVTLQDDQDKRKQRVNLTDHGRKVEEELITFKKSYADQVFKDISQEDQDHLERILSKIKENMLEFNNEKND